MAAIGPPSRTKSRVAHKWEYQCTLASLESAWVKPLHPACVGGRGGCVIVLHSMDEEVEGTECDCAATLPEQCRTPRRPHPPVHQGKQWTVPSTKQQAFLAAPRQRHTTPNVKSTLDKRVCGATQWWVQFVTSPVRGLGCTGNGWCLAGPCPFIASPFPLWGNDGICNLGLPDPWGRTVGCVVWVCPAAVEAVCGTEDAVPQENWGQSSLS